MAKKNNNYFELLAMQVRCCVKASELLVNILDGYSSEKLNNQRELMHEIEHNADDLHHEILMKLSREFITPIDQEDILRLVQIIDDVTDALDEVVIDMYMYNVVKLPDDTLQLAKTVNRCVQALEDSIGELKNFKKPDRLRNLLIEVNSIESEADAIYVEAVHRLFTSDIGVREIIGGRAIYESLENCCDLCEHAADVIEQTVIKNV